MSLQQLLAPNGNMYVLAYDQGLEHGPSLDFNQLNVNPSYIIDIALNGGVSALAMQYGIAKKYYTTEIRSKIPLILKLNGKSKLNSKNFVPAVVASVEDALNLGAAAIGFTINPGIEGESIGYEQFSILRSEAESAGLATVLWSYARGPEIQDQHAVDVVAYAARIAAELGADAVKVKYTGDPESFKWVVKSAAGTLVVASGTDRFDKSDYPAAVADMMNSGAKGIAVGRNVWQAENPIEMSRKLSEIICGGAQNPESVL